MESEFKVCYVVWRDAAFFRNAGSGWYNRDELESILEREWPLMKTVGWLIDQDDEKVAVALSVSVKAVGDILVIPRGMVCDVRILEDPPTDLENGPVPVARLDAAPLRSLPDEKRALRIAVAAAQEQ